MAAPISTVCPWNDFCIKQFTERETYLSGYRIPKGANTLVNFYCVHNDPELYEEPEKFNPSRFIQVDGKRREELPILFGVGKRACLGENITMTEVFLFLTTIVQNFHLTLAESSNSSYSLFLNGKLFICAQPRNKN
ncbi:Cytochrome P450 2U1 [Araneus ventricosus]|uniref:Cytochrome P450 2U1 n=1 Tax=Araneus ventricosus TaxID=182803 RepID=A0A4Y2VLI0_ARAVE|nr:Cytochrome P450 2U1 [Araneus ventricosus]GBO25473.1 Cytochrome P450 2U1 [Araneus ventricosus]